MNTLLLFVHPQTEDEDIALERLGYKTGPEDEQGVRCRWIKETPNLLPMVLRDLAKANITCPSMEIDMSWISQEDWSDVDHDLLHGIGHWLSPGQTFPQS